MDFQQLCTALRSMETLPGDARVVDAQMIWALHQHGPMTSEELEQRLAMSNSSISRRAQRLGSTNRQGEPGYGLIRSGRDPREGRRFVYGLTKAAQALLAS